MEAYHTEHTKTNTLKCNILQLGN